jgi:hypothetical protein
MSLPNTVAVVHNLTASAAAKETLENILQRKQDLEDYVAVVQPLLYTMSVALYGEDDHSDVDLSVLVSDALVYINQTRMKND